MRIRKAILAASLLVTGISLASCRDHPGRWGDHHGHHDNDRDHDHDGHRY